MTRQFDVFDHPSAAMRRRYPHLIVLQHESISSSGNAVIAPLSRPLSQQVSRAYPLLELLGTTVMMLTPDLAVISRRLLNNPVANLSEQRYLILAAIDMLLVGS